MEVSGGGGRGRVVNLHRCYEWCNEELKLVLKIIVFLSLPSINSHFFHDIFVMNVFYVLLCLYWQLIIGTDEKQEDEGMGGKMGWKKDDDRKKEVGGWPHWLSERRVWEEKVQTSRREGDCTDFKICAVGKGNSGGGTEDSLCQVFTKRTIKVCWNISLQLDEAWSPFPEIMACPSLSWPEAPHLLNSLTRCEMFTARYPSQQMSRRPFVSRRVEHVRKSRHGSGPSWTSVPGRRGRHICPSTSNKSFQKCAQFSGEKRFRTTNWPPWCQEKHVVDVLQNSTGGAQVPR